MGLLKHWEEEKILVNIILSFFYNILHISKGI